ncbi:MAG: Rne/Rng family ribonuclease [Robiginitomaculum sp.]|nr:Rne/Rng family ribonuclease [Robiginitomaculum sp.]
MSKKMLIDASHPEETRVVIVDGTRVEELDFESKNKRQLRGNVYLARVTRVEPSLQAAFVEYGGNRHGFLAFSEIHADYYQIPHEDRMALLEAEKAESLEEDAEEESKRSSKHKNSKAKKDDKNSDETDDSQSEDASGKTENDNEDKSDDNGEDDIADASEKEAEDEQNKMLGARRKRQSRRRYKIQEVIKRGQILLIQAVKEERGNKGAAMTTYLSLAGRYCVLMPNTPRGGGISRKISNGSDRKRLKAVMSELSVPQGMGVIVRTAGAKRTKVEIKRDYDYLSRLWDTIRDKTLKSIAPALIHEEGNLVKRSIRDLYGKDIDSILVQGDEAYRVAKDFIKMLMPSHAKNVQPYKDDIPLFLRYQVEQQIETCLEPIAQLKSGGYLVIHPTEALVSVDVNSGRSTKERNVERTALKTNLETADELARQMRLRDLAGLIVVDFIDMDENRNNRAVEKRMRDALSRDRARVQMSKISQFGLMEISRQRRRRSLLEGSTASCEHCHGVGRKRSTESSALKAIRAVEEEGIRGRSSRIRLKVTPDVAEYILNEKRDLLNQIEASTNMFTEIVSESSFIRPQFEIESLVANPDQKTDPLEMVIKENRKANHQRKNKNPNDKDKQTQAEESHDKIETTDEDKPAKRKRRRGRRGGRGRRNDAETANVETSPSENVQSEDKQKSDTNKADENPTQKPAKKAIADTKEDTSEAKPKRARRPRKIASKAQTTTQADKPTAEANKPMPAKKEPPKATKKGKEDKVEPETKKTSTKKAAPKKTVAKKAVTKKAVTKKAITKKAVKTPKDKPEVTKKAKPAPKKPSTAKVEDSPKAAKESESTPAKKGWWKKRNPFN